MIKFLLPLALFATALPLAPLHAEPANRVAVTYADLNLASASGVAVLDRRIARALDTVCSDYTLFQRAFRECRARAAALVVPQRDAAIARASHGQSLAVKAY